MAIDRISPVVSIRETDEASRRSQDSIIASVRQLASKEITAGILLKDLYIKTSTTNVAHQLKRKPLGYIVCGQNAAAMIWQISLDTQFLYLQASVNVTINLWAF